VSLRVDVTPAATEDVIREAAFIAERNVPSARRLVEAIDRTLERLATSPDVGTRLRFRKRSLDGLRVLTVPRFSNYLLFYRRLPDCIEIVRVLHGARNWRRILNRM
jgi:toxin ParE1/3/4